MTLRASRLRELENPNLSVGGRAELCCEVAREFENKGEYEEARKALSNYWRHIGERPNLEGLDQSTAGEVLLRIGVLTGFIGSQNQITDAQETAKNLISESLTIFHEHLDRARRIFLSLKDVGTVAQVDETRACVFLQQGRFVDAERAARSSVRRLEQGDRQAILVEALVTHGRALARLGSYSEALVSFRRAVDLADHTGNTNWTAQAALAAFREMGDRLTVAGKQKLFLSLGDRKQARSFEHDGIKLALENAKGSVTYAARSLGISHQALTYMLNTRHKDLLKLRIPPKRRARRQ